VPGALAVTNDIDLLPEPADADIQQAIMSAFRRNASLTVHALSVDVPCSGIVTLSGTVTSCAEHDNAVTAGWSARGVVRVDDRIIVMY
jgi:osmotically-inducible protein OsmY